MSPLSSHYHTQKPTEVPKLFCNNAQIDFQLNNAHPQLQQRPNYTFTQHTDYSENDTTADAFLASPDPTSDSDEDSDLSTDDMIIDEEEEGPDACLEDPLESLYPPPISNIFMHHPHYNQYNSDYQQALSLYIQQQSPYCVLNTHSIQIPTNVVKVPIKSPESPNDTITIEAAADSQSDIEAIGIKPYIYYQRRGLVKSDPIGITIATGNGKVHVTNYVPITVLSRTGQQFDRKFWCLESLPTYDFLLGKHLLNRLGWEYVNRYDIWEHKPANLDYVEQELDDLRCTNYPLPGKTDVNIDAVNIPNPRLEPFIRRQLAQYKEVIAKHEWDSGRILDIEPFGIDFIPQDHPYKDGFMSKEYWTNADQKREVNRQLDGMIKYDLIEEITSGKSKYISLMLL